MPWKPKRPCSYPGCPNLTEGRFCPEHEKQENRNYQKYGRDKAAQRVYKTAAWQRLRKAYKDAHPLCEICLAAGKYVKATDIHHRVPLSEGGENSLGNLMALCKACHARLHSQRGDRWKKF